MGVFLAECFKRKIFVENGGKMLVEIKNPQWLFQGWKLCLIKTLILKSGKNLKYRMKIEGKLNRKNINHRKSIKTRSKHTKNMKIAKNKLSRHQIKCSK